MQGYFAICYHCNQNCITCPSSSEEKNNKFIEFNVFKSNVLTAVNRGMNRIVLSGGEPFSHPRIKDILIFLSKLNISITILSNGSLIDESYLKLLKRMRNRLRIVTAIHSNSVEVHDMVTGINGNFLKTINNLKRLNENGISIGIKIILNKLNINSLNSISLLLENNFKYRFNINICGMDYCGKANKHLDLILSKDEIQKGLDEYVKWYVNSRKSKFSICITELPLCFSTRDSIAFFQIKQSRNQFAYQAGNSNSSVFFNTPYDCYPQCERCLECLFYKICPGIWTSTKEIYKKDLIPLKECGYK